MASFNFSTRQMSAKVVYYGPGLCGKTTSLKYVFHHTRPDARGKMVSLATETDRTLFFDLLPLEVGTVAGFHTRIQLYTVPGQVFYNSTRRLVLKGVDGIVFVADSQPAMLPSNVESFRNLEVNLEELGIDIDEIPLVLQYNKRDLPEVCSVAELREALNSNGWPEFETSAISGEGIFEVLREISKLTLISLKQQLEDGVPETLTPPGPTIVEPTPEPVPEALDETTAAEADFPAEAAVSATPEVEADTAAEEPAAEEETAEVASSDSEPESQPEPESQSEPEARSEPESIATAPEDSADGEAEETAAEAADETPTDDEIEDMALDALDGGAPPSRPRVETELVDAKPDEEPEAEFAEGEPEEGEPAESESAAEDAVVPEDERLAAVQEEAAEEAEVDAEPSSDPVEDEADSVEAASEETAADEAGKPEQTEESAADDAPEDAPVEAALAEADEKARDDAEERATAAAQDSPDEEPAASEDEDEAQDVPDEATAEAVEELAATNGRRHIDQDLVVALAGDDLSRARQISLDLQVRDERNRVLHQQRDIQWSLEAIDRLQDVLLHLRIELEQEDAESASD